MGTLVVNDVKGFKIGNDTYKFDTGELTSAIQGAELYLNSVELLLDQYLERLEDIENACAYLGIEL